MGAGFSNLPLFLFLFVDYIKYAHIISFSFISEHSAFKEEITKETVQENYHKGAYDELSIEIDVIEMPKQINIQLLFQPSNK